MATAEQARAALAIGNEHRRVARRERSELVGESVDVVSAALIQPSEALGSMRLADILGTRGRHRAGVIPKCGQRSLSLTFLQLINEHPMGRQWWHAELRLNELTETERRRLVNALVQRAPESWRASAPEGRS